MTEKEFLIYNQHYKQRQAAIRAEREQSEPVRLGKLIPGVLDNIQRWQQKIESTGGIR